MHTGASGCLQEKGGGSFVMCSVLVRFAFEQVIGRLRNQPLDGDPAVYAVNTDWMDLYKQQGQVKGSKI
jgi:hypothetical protein